MSMREELNAMGAEALNRELSSLSDYELVQRAIGCIETSNYLELPTFEEAGAIFRPLSSYRDESGMPMDIPRPVLEGDHLTFRYATKQAMHASATYVALWDKAQESAVYTIDASVPVEETAGSFPVGEWLSNHLPRMETPLRPIDQARTFFVREGYAYRHANAIIVPPKVALRPGEDVEASFRFTDETHGIGFPRPAIIELAGTFTATPPTHGYVKLDANRLLGTAAGTGELPVQTRVRKDVQLPDSTDRLEVNGDTLNVISKYSYNPTRPISLEGLNADYLNLHRSLADQLGWTDITEQFISDNYPAIAHMAPVHDREAAVPALVRAIEAARSNPDNPVAPRVVGNRQVVQFLAKQFGGPQDIPLGR